MQQIVTLKVNGDVHEIAAPPGRTLLDALRDDLGLTGSKKGCDMGTCGVCTVEIDGLAVLACLTLAVECDGRDIRTIEGISGTDELHPVQQSFIDHGAIQCGFCTPGIIMTAKTLLDDNPAPTEEEINDALAGTFCRCTGHIKIKEAIKNLAK